MRLQQPLKFFFLLLSLCPLKIMFAAKQIQQSLNHEMRNFAKLNIEHSQTLTEYYSMFESMQSQYGNRAFLDYSLRFLFLFFSGKSSVFNIIFTAETILFIALHQQFMIQLCECWTDQVKIYLRIELNRCSMSTEHWVLRTVQKHTGEKCEFYTYDCLVELRDPFFTIIKHLVYLNMVWEMCYSPLYPVPIIAERNSVKLKKRLQLISFHLAYRVKGIVWCSFFRSILYFFLRIRILKKGIDHGFIQLLIR